ncbi:MAG TPA: DegQ family serine endoprotease [Candidatus Competibacteraceae bacterium]|nr:DegQ family serine endoprotease [Candidatus Competibacteraceae bacterium]
MTRFVPTLALLALLSWGSVASAQTPFPDFTRLVEENSAAVVSIEASSGNEEESDNGGLDNLPIPEDSPFYDYFRRFFEQNPQIPRPPQASTGSGFIISADGYVLTNAHVVESAAEITVHLADRRELKATLVGSDNRSDIALLKVEGRDLPTVKIGDPQKLKVGQWVLAIGSPFGFDYTATQGIISSLGRNLPSGNYVPFIQTDAAVNPGNSGGPLFNLAGEVIGINSQIYSRTGGYQGVSFAIPIDIAMDVVDQLKTTGKVLRGWLGVMIQEVTGELAQSFGLDRPRGALVGQVLEDSPAAKAGVQVGDIILAFNGQPVTSSGELPPLVGRVRPGNKSQLTLFRGGKEMTLEVTIEELPDSPKQAAAGGTMPQANRLKITVAEVPTEQRQDGGVAVSKVEDGPAARAGIQVGDIILRLNNKPVNSVTEFNALVKELPTGKPVPVLIKRGDGALFLALTLSTKE